MSNEVMEKSSGDERNMVVWLSISAAKACPFCSRHHFDIREAVTYKMCECGATYTAEWDEPHMVTKYVWRRGA